MADLVAPLPRMRRRPDEHQCLNHRADRLELRDDEDPRALLARVDVVAEVTWHGAAVMRDENALLSGGNLQHFRVTQAGETAVRGGGEIHGALTAADRQNDVVIEVSVGLKADQGRGSLGEDAPA